MLPLDGIVSRSQRCQTGGHTLLLERANAFSWSYGAPRSRPHPRCAWRWCGPLRVMRLLPCVRSGPERAHDPVWAEPSSRPTSAARTTVTVLTHLALKTNVEHCSSFLVKEYWSPSELPLHSGTRTGVVSPLETSTWFSITCVSADCWESNPDPPVLREFLTVPAVQSPDPLCASSGSGLLVKTKRRGLLRDTLSYAFQFS